MARKRRSRQIPMDDLLWSLDEPVPEDQDPHLSNPETGKIESAAKINARQKDLMKELQRLGPEQFTRKLAWQLAPRFRPEKTVETIDPQRDKKLQNRLEVDLAKNHSIDGLQIKFDYFMGMLLENTTVWYGLPLTASPKNYSAAMEVARDYLIDLARERAEPLGKRLFEAYHWRSSYQELADDLNLAVDHWAAGEFTGWEDVLFDEYLRRDRGLTPENYRREKQKDEDYEFFDAEKVKRIIDYYLTHK